MLEIRTWAEHLFWPW